MFPADGNAENRPGALAPDDNRLPNDLCLAKRPIRCLPIRCIGPDKIEVIYEAAMVGP